MVRLFIPSVNGLESNSWLWFSEGWIKIIGVLFHFFLIDKREFQVGTMVSSKVVSVVLTVIAIRKMADCQIIERQGGRR